MKSAKVLLYFGLDCGMFGRKAHANHDPNKQEVGFIFA
jgi:hypothetical protein